MERCFQMCRNQIFYWPFSDVQLLSSEFFFQIRWLIVGTVTTIATTSCHLTLPAPDFFLSRSPVFVVHTRMIFFWGEKSNFHSPTIAKVWFSTFNYEIGQHMPSNCQNRANLAPRVVLKVIFHFVRIKNIQFYTKKFISDSF